MLRRTKLDQNPDGSALLKLPARHVEVLKCSWADEAEQEFYDALKNRVEITFNKFAKKGIMQSYIKVLTLLLRLRQGINILSVLRDDTSDSDDFSLPASPLGLQRRGF